MKGPRWTTGERDIFFLGIYIAEQLQKHPQLSLDGEEPVALLGLAEAGLNLEAFRCVEEAAEVIRLLLSGNIIHHSEGTFYDRKS